jgi:release factor glutamine methyltransferase
MAKSIKRNLKKCTPGMKKTELFDKIRFDLQDKIHFLEDKPEETPETTVKALWLTASGLPVSAEGSLVHSIPDLTVEQVKILYKLIDLRINNTPLAYITNRQRFMGIDMLADRRALIPRKETEILGKKALELASLISKTNGKIKVIDVCCGSGNLGLAIASYNRECELYATDLSPEAVELTLDNINFLKLNDRIIVKQGDLLSAFESNDYYNKIDLIVCNPPYILSSKVEKMDAEISSNEPVLAFDGGMLGIKIIQKLISEAPKFLTPAGWMVFEVGVGQGEFVIKLCERSKSYQNIQSVADHAGNIRVIAAQKSI